VIVIYSIFILEFDGFGMNCEQGVTSRLSQPVPFLEERAELDALLASGIFVRAPSLEQLLTYVCQKYFSGNTAHIKEYNIAVEGLGRPAGFDQKADAIVRVEAHRLRKRLKQYYEGEGAGHPIRISISPGSYVPHFIRVAGLEPSLEGAPSELLPALTAKTVAIPVPFVGLRRRWPILSVALLLALLLGVAFRAVRGRANTPRSESLFLSEDQTRILVGAPNGRYVDRLGQTWLGDRFFSGGVTLENTAHTVERTPDAILYQTRREGEFGYDIPLKPGVYELRLYFMEPVYGAGKAAGGGETSRLFTMTINGRKMLSAFDILSDAGGSDIADIKVFKDISPDRDGSLHLHFKGERGPALLNAIEILPAVAGRSKPVRILAQEGMYVDRQGRVWSGDRFFNGGQTVVRSDPVRNVTEPVVYHGERYGHFTYTIPMARGRYAITLHFAETWFGPHKPGGGGEGSRMFDVYCNGVALLKDFDIYKAAGGSDVAIDRTFTGLEPNAQDKFVLSFVPVRNYACVNAIEVE
jgi:hypothetical protein